MAYTLNELLTVMDTSTAELDPDSNSVVSNLQKSDDNEDTLTSIPVFGTLGVCSRPVAKTSKGACESIVFDNLCVVAQRDTRTNSMYGALDEGDTALYSTDEKSNARVLLKGEKHSANIIVNQPDGKQIIFSIDGINKEINILGFGTFLKLSEEGGVTLGCKGANITLTQQGTIMLNGLAVLVGSGANAPVVAMVGGVPTPCAGMFCKAI